jgi:hypothetical protein
MLGLFLGKKPLFYITDQSTVTVAIEGIALDGQIRLMGLFAQITPLTLMILKARKGSPLILVVTIRQAGEATGVMVVLLGQAYILAQLRIFWRN